MNANDRFETVGELYRADTGRLRPGKDDRLHDSSSEENCARFDQWFATQSFNSALARIVSLQELAEEALQFLAGYEDVLDGDYGEPKPNAAMQLCNQIREALGRRPGP